MLLMSFCNTGDPEKSLGVLNENTHELKFVGIDYDKCIGVTGITRNGYDWIIAIQAEDHSAIAFFSYFFNLVKICALYKTKDIHSIYLDGSVLYLASTGNNSIYYINLNDPSMEEELYYQYVPFSDDRVHLNSLTKVNGDVCYSIFGEREPGQTWREVSNDGKILSSSGKIIVERVSRPHSINFFNGRLSYCESGNKSFVVDGLGNIGLEGFTRGIAYDEKNYYVGISSHRHISRHTGKVYEDEGENSKCGVSVIDGKSLSVLKNIMFDDLDAEIYSIVHWW